MRRTLLRASARLGRAISLVVLATLGTILLTRLAPGYFSDMQELDAAHAASTQIRLARLQASQGSVTDLLQSEGRLLLHADFGTSRHFDLPVSALLRERAWVSGRILLAGTLSSWALAISLSLLLSARRGRRWDAVLSATTALLLALPIGALATLCLLLNVAGPVFALALLVGTRDFKFLYRILRESWQAPHILYARAQGLTVAQTVGFHLLASVGREILALAMTSFTLALSALVPVEVIFDVPGLGQLAWNAAMNRDLPVLVAVTALMASCVAFAGLFTSSNRTLDQSLCA